MNEEINLTDKSSDEVIEEYYKIAIDTKNTIEKYERTPELVDAFLENYSLINDNDDDELE